ncbi:hypothetical protein TRFO_38143 [Tritrichomonas foetus]|uniref:Uncharacterized protein n=1 Tax=Tritrichomonas foetus TaxID=1144522 RepID=A0A1J4J988_9EUKA|nr:hypothetical protein TRFO_38143 [Tritrichomonas foetus]|eukprot:OHS95754.1 hypothetical protein TRFO_38143 [Tritrichomonas foetus]
MLPISIIHNLNNSSFNDSFTNEEFSPDLIYSKITLPRLNDQPNRKKKPKTFLKTGRKASNVPKENIFHILQQSLNQEDIDH